MANTQYHTFNQKSYSKKWKDKIFCVLVYTALFENMGTHVLSECMRKAYYLKLDSNKRSGSVKWLYNCTGGNSIWEYRI